MAYFHTNVLDNQIKALPTVSTASGAICTFDTDMTENLIEVVCEIVYSQASGTPTPVNPLPITTFSEMNVCATGKNFIDSTGTWFGTDVSSWGLSDSVLVSALNKLPIGNYTVSFKVKLKELKSGYTGGRYGLIFRAIKADNTQYNVVIQSDKTDVTEGDIWDFSGSLNITSETVGRFAFVYFYTGRSPTSNADVCEFYDLQIELGNEVTAYEPYGNTYNIPFGQTVAKGTLNVSTGVLEITHLYQLFTGDNSEAWTSSPSGGHYRYLIARGDLIVGQIAKSNLFECVETSAQADNYKFYIGNSYVTFYYDDATTLSAWRTFLSNNNLQLVGELTTPLTVQLDSNTITALLNENNIWCDTNGDTSVKFLMTVGKAIS